MNVLAGGYTMPQGFRVCVCVFTSSVWYKYKIPTLIL